VKASYLTYQGKTGFNSIFHFCARFFFNTSLWKKEKEKLRMSFLVQNSAHCFYLLLLKYPSDPQEKCLAEVLHELFILSINECDESIKNRTPSFVPESSHIIATTFRKMLHYLFIE
jgi:hypothetical protein